MALPALIAATALATLTACSSPHSKDHPHVSESFSTHITEDGSKLFTYELSAQRPKERQARGMPPGGDSGNRDSRAERAKKMMNQRVLDRLENKLEETGYCREGYFTLEKTLSRGKASVRGECKEAANDTDIEQFR